MDLHPLCSFTRTISELSSVYLLVLQDKDIIQNVRF